MKGKSIDSCPQLGKPKTPILEKIPKFKEWQFHFDTASVPLAFQLIQTQNSVS